MAKMTDEKVRRLRARYAQGGIGILTLACEYDIAYSTCRDIINRTTWKHVTDLPTKPCDHCCGSGQVPM